MCTLTIVPWQPDGPQTPGVRIVCSRDESVLRPVARPPELHRAGERQLLMPVDPVSEGTWIGVSDAPLAGILMNVYLEQATPPDALLPRDTPPVSRGMLIPRILAAADLSEALKLADKLEVSRFEPFRLILVDRQRYAEIVWAAEQFSVSQAMPVAEPLFFTSSGLGDDVVARPRQKLFEELFADHTKLAAAQDAFHRHTWPGREFASVWMTRREARTQSITWLEIGAGGAQMSYGARNGGTEELVVRDAQMLPAGSQLPGSEATSSEP